MTEAIVDSAVIRRLWSGHQGAFLPVQRRQSGRPDGNDSKVPAAQVRASPTELTLYVELPGVRPADIAIEHDDAGLLYVVAQSADGECLYERTFDFARAYDAERATARFALGLLTLTVPQRTAVVHESERPDRAA